MQCQVTNTHSKYVHTYVHTYGVTPVVHGGGHGYLQGLPEQPHRLHGSCFQPPSLRSCKPQGLISARRTNSLMPSHANEAPGLAARLAASRLQQPEGGIPQVSRADCVCSKCTPTHTTVCGGALCTVWYSPNNRESLTSSPCTCSGGVTE